MKRQELKTKPITVEQKILELFARNKCLSVSEVALLLDEDEKLIRRRIESLIVFKELKIMNKVHVSKFGLCEA